MDRQTTSEKGQALVLIVLALVGLLGFTALAVDASMVYADRRFVQGAADSAALAGVSAAGVSFGSQDITANTWSCSNSAMTAAKTTARNAAIASAAGNQQVIDANLDDHHGVKVSCYSGSDDKYLEVEVQVTQETATGFAHLLTDSGTVNTVTAVARVRPSQSAFGSYTIIAMNPAACSGLKYGALFNGNTTVKICGGGIISNGCMRASGYISTDVKASNCTTAVSTGAYYVRELKINPNSNAEFEESPGETPAFPVEEVADASTAPVMVDLFAGAKALYAPSYCHISPYPIKVDPLPEDFCQLAETPAQMCSRAGANHVSGSDLPEALTAGLWCVTGDVKLSGSKGKLSGSDVTLVFLDGGLSCTGNCKINLKAPANDSADPYPAERGLLFYSLDNDTWKLNGNNQSYFYGSIFLPYADVEMMGTGNENGFHTQVCAYNFHTGGTNDSKWIWDENYVYKQPPAVELTR